MRPECPVKTVESCNKKEFIKKLISIFSRVFKKNLILSLFHPKRGSFVDNMLIPL
jgi:hypothetical protein